MTNKKSLGGVTLAQVKKAEKRYAKLCKAKAEDGVQLPTLDEIDSFIAEDLNRLIPPATRI